MNDVSLVLMIMMDGWFVWFNGMLQFNVPWTTRAYCRYLSDNDKSLENTLKCSKHTEHTEKQRTPRNLMSSRNTRKGISSSACHVVCGPQIVAGSGWISMQWQVERRCCDGDNEPANTVAGYSTPWFSLPVKLYLTDPRRFPIRSMNVWIYCIFFSLAVLWVASKLRQ